MLNIPYFHSPQQIHFRLSGIRSQKLGIRALYLRYTHRHTCACTHTLSLLHLHYLTPWVLLPILIGLDFTIILDNITLRLQKNFLQTRNMRTFQKKNQFFNIKHQQFYTVPRFFEFLALKILALLFPLH